MIHRRLALRRWLTRAFLQVSSRRPVCLLLDKFSDANNTNLTAHTPAPINPLSLSWEAHYSTIKIINDLAGAFDDYAIYTVNPGISDCIVSADITCGGLHEDTSGVIVRASDGWHLWKICLTSQYKKLYILECDASEVQRAAASVDISIQIPYTIRVASNGANISATLDGGHLISYSSATFNQTAVKHGLSLRYIGDLADNFKIERLP